MAETIKNMSGFGALAAGLGGPEVRAYSAGTSPTILIVLFVIITILTSVAAYFSFVGNSVGVQATSIVSAILALTGIVSWFVMYRYHRLGFYCVQ